MRAVVKILLFAVIAFLLLMTHAVFFGHTDCFVILPFAKVLVNGKPVQGWLHRELKGRQLVVTRINSVRVRESYLIFFTQRGTSANLCAGWLPAGSPIFMLGDLSSPCFQLKIVSESELNAVPVTHWPKPETGPKFVEFSAHDGVRIRATW